MNKANEKFKYTVEYQWDLLRYITQDKNGELALKKVDDDYFTLIEHQVIVFTLKKYFKKYRNIPGETILRESLISTMTNKQWVNLITKNEQNEILNLIKPLYREIVKDGDIVYNMCKDFSTYIKMKHTIENIDINDFESYPQFSQSIQSIMVNEDEVDNIASSFLLADIKNRQLRRQQHSSIYPTPFRQINQLTNAGGYEKGSTIVILDKQKKGKTMILANVTRGYLRMRKKILVIDYENGADNWVSRLEQSMMSINKVDLLSGDYDEKIQARFRKYKRLGGEVVVLRLPAKVTTCNDLQNKMDLLYKEFGFKADILVLDYAAKMGSITRKDDDHARISDVYVEINNLALKNDIEHIWTANHVTRDGARNREKTRYKGEDIALCIDIVRHAHAIFGLNRSEPEEEAGFLRMELVEQRDGVQNGRAVFKVEQDTQRADELKTHERKEYDEIFTEILENTKEEKTFVKKERKNDFAD